MTIMPRHARRSFTIAAPKKQSRATPGLDSGAKRNRFTVGFLGQIINLEIVRGLTSRLCQSSPARKLIKNFLRVPPQPCEIAARNRALDRSKPNADFELSSRNFLQLPLCRREKMRRIIRGAASRFLLHPSPTIQIGPALVAAKFTTCCSGSGRTEHNCPDRFEPIRFRPGGI
jgi:hypothetical protein